MRNCCCERCVGCQRGWSYDEQYRHIGPVKAPHSNRWACSRVQWLGVNGSLPCEPGGVDGVMWINGSGATVLWQDAAWALVPWVTGRGAPVVTLSLAA
jgi:hypothetical protein